MKLLVILLALMEVGLALYYIRMFFLRLPRLFCPHLAMIAAMLFYFAGGTALAYLSVSDDALFDMLSSRKIGHENVLAALVLTLAFAMLIHAVSERLLPYVAVSQPVLKHSFDQATQTSQFSVISALIIGIYAYLIASGRVVFHGTETVDDVSGVADPLLMIMGAALYLLPIVCGYRLFMPGKLWTTLPVTLIGAGLALSEGRRNLIIFLFCLLVGYALNTSIKLKTGVKIAIVSGIAGLAILGFLVSVAVRMAHWSSPKSTSGVEVAALAGDLLLNPPQDQSQSVTANTQQNVNTRGFNPEVFIAEMTSAGRDKVGALGEVFVNAVLSGIPSAIYQNKDADTTSEEEIATNTFSLVFAEDEGNSLLSGAYTDFREFGVVIYAMFTVIIIGISIALTRATRIHALRLLSISNLLVAALGAENAMVTWFLLLRMLLTIFLIDQFLQSLRVQPRSARVHRPLVSPTFLPEYVAPQPALADPSARGQD